MIDLRSDTVTRPCPEMRRVMADAPVGDDVYGEDPTVNRLEEMAAAMAGMESALFLPSGTQSNLAALLAHCQRGEEYIVGQQAHTYKYEGGGAAVLGSIQPQPLEFEADGTLDLVKVGQAIKADDYHFAKTRLLALENTIRGMVLPMDYLHRVSAFVKQHGLKLHLDGARVCNAAVALKLPVSDITGLFDSVSICLSKGLGAPAGSVLCGTRDFVAAARRWRKVLGGGMRQAGILAAAGIFALENNIRRLRADHENASLLAQGLNSCPGLRVQNGGAQTNMVFLEVSGEQESAFVGFAAEHGILLSVGRPMRLVTHKDVEREDMMRVIEVLQAFRFPQ